MRRSAPGSCTGRSGSARPGSFHGLPGIEQAATIIHQGPMGEVMPAGQARARWIDGNGYRPLGLLREVYLERGSDQESPVTELQTPVAAVTG